MYSSVTEQVSKRYNEMWKESASKIERVKPTCSFGAVRLGNFLHKLPTVIWRWGRVCGQAVVCEPGFIFPRRYVSKWNGVEGREGMFYLLVCDSFPTQENHEEERLTRCWMQSHKLWEKNGWGLPGDFSSTLYPGRTLQQWEVITFECTTDTRPAGVEEATRIMRRGSRGDNSR